MQNDKLVGREGEAPLQNGGDTLKKEIAKNGFGWNKRGRQAISQTGALKNKCKGL